MGPQDWHWMLDDKYYYAVTFATNEMCNHTSLTGVQHPFCFACASAKWIQGTLAVTEGFCSSSGPVFLSYVDYMDFQTELLAYKKIGLGTEITILCQGWARLGDVDEFMGYSRISDCESYVCDVFWRKLSSTFNCLMGDFLAGLVRTGRQPVPSVL